MVITGTLRLILIGLLAEVVVRRIWEPDAELKTIEEQRFLVGGQGVKPPHQFRIAKFSDARDLAVILQYHLAVSEEIGVKIMPASAIEYLGDNVSTELDESPRVSPGLKQINRQFSGLPTPNVP
jgi:hypothetical protein